MKTTRKPYTILTDFQRAALVADYVAGHTRTSLARKYGIAQPTASDIICRAGVMIRDSERRKRHFVSPDAFATVTPASAYFAGLLMADGSVHWRSKSCAAIKLALKETDRPLVEQFRNYLGTTSPIRIRTKKLHGGYQSKSLAELVVLDASLAHRLERFGVVARKSTNAAATVQVASDRHFWRGVVDGDGTICVQPSGWNQVYPMLRLIGAEPLMSQFLAFVRQVAPACKATVRPHKTIFSVSLMGKHGYMLISELYRNCEHALPRKLATANAILIGFSGRYTSVK